MKLAVPYFLDRDISLAYELVKAVSIVPLRETETIVS